MGEDQFEELRSAIKDGNSDRAVSIAGELAGDEAALNGAVEVAVQTIREVGDLFEEGSCFLPEMLLSAEAMQAFMGVATARLGSSAKRASGLGKVLLCTVKGDIHTIGKDIVATMLSASGYEVIDMGVDVAPIEVVERAEKERAKVIALSALMTASMPYQKEVIDLLRELKMRDDYWVIVGGGPVTPAYADAIGADGWGLTAGSAVALCEKMLRNGGTPAAVQFMTEGE